MTQAEMRLAQIRGRREHLRHIGQLPKRRRLPPQLHPTAIARSYYRALSDMMEAARAEVRDVILNPGLLAAWEREAGTWRQDAAGDDVAKKVERVSGQFFRTFTNERIRSTAERYARTTASFQKEQLGKQVRAAIGVDTVDMFRSEPWLEPRVNAFTAENVALIKSVPEQYFSQVQSTILRGVRSGARPESIAEDLQERFDVSESKAQLIARDQVSKFFGELNKERQTDLGVERAIWRTSGDERVRPSHAAMEGVNFAWDDPPVVDGEAVIPSEPINCRCFGEPDFTAILESL